MLVEHARNLRRAANRLPDTLQLLREAFAEGDSVLFAGRFHRRKITKLGSNYIETNGLPW